MLDGLRAGAHITIPPRLLAGMSHLQTEYTPKTKFITASARKLTRSVFEDAVANALQAFKDQGALSPVRFDEDDVVVQVYPKDLKVAVIFQRLIVGEVYFSHSFYDLPKPALDALLEAAGKKHREH